MFRTLKSGWVLYKDLAIEAPFVAFAALTVLLLGELVLTVMMFTVMMARAWPVFLVLGVVGLVLWRLQKLIQQMARTSR